LLEDPTVARGGSLVTDCAAEKMRFDTPAAPALEAAFDGGHLTSDGGICYLAEVDKELGVCG
jgi:hypothetical protein